MSYAVSIFLNQVILKNGFPFNVELPQVNETEVEALFKIIESTGGNREVSEKNQKIIHLFAIGDIDYETAVFAIKRSFIRQWKIHYTLANAIIDRLVHHSHIIKITGQSYHIKGKLLYDEEGDVGNR